MQPHSSSLHFPHSITLTTPSCPLPQCTAAFCPPPLIYSSDPSLLLQQVRGTCTFTLSQSAASNSYIFSSSTGIRLVKVMSKTKPLHVQHFKKEIQGETWSSSPGECSPRRSAKLGHIIYSGEGFSVSVLTSGMLEITGLVNLLNNCRLVIITVCSECGFNDILNGILICGYS